MCGQDTCIPMTQQISDLAEIEFISDDSCGEQSGIGKEPEV